MYREVDKDTAREAALKEQDVIKFYPGVDGTRVMSVTRAIDELFDDESKFLIDIPEEEPEGPTEEEPQRKPGRKKRLKLDTGKIRALYNAGWSYDKIADEIGVSSSTIRRVIVKEDSKDGDD